jgi:hypothetical protein
MKISEIVKKLNAIKRKHGDLEVKYAEKHEYQYGTGTWDTQVTHKDVITVDAREEEVGIGNWETRKTGKVFVELDEY